MWDIIPKRSSCHRFCLHTHPIRLRLLPLLLLWFPSPSLFIIIITVIIIVVAIMVIIIVTILKEYEEKYDVMNIHTSTLPSNSQFHTFHLNRVSFLSISFQRFSPKSHTKFLSFPPLSPLPLFPLFPRHTHKQHGVGQVRNCKGDQYGHFGSEISLQDVASTLPHFPGE
mmetsp:Transcript_15355/g.24026  ORF Transcript_15355/g.24026 Transcript_15355/m.24026 type:complete len:169 (-) Transcript_15355:1366-1872(-)